MRRVAASGSRGKQHELATMIGQYEGNQWVSLLGFAIPIGNGAFEKVRLLGFSHSAF